MKLIGIPLGKGGLGHGDGAASAPPKINEALKELFANEDGEEISFTYDEIELSQTSLQEQHDVVKKAVGELQEKAILIGGDHSLTHPAVKGFAKKTKEFHFIVLDAHPDLMDDFRPPTQEDYLRVLIEEGIVNPKQCTLLGVRNWDKQEIEYLKEKGITCYTAKELFTRGVKEIMQEILKLITLPLYLSVDIDVVDPVEAIGTGYTEHGGISSRELIYILQELKTTGKLAMVDIVEVNPDKDVNNITSTLAAKCIVELGDF